jgi:hypothetical protein
MAAADVLAFTETWIGSRDGWPTTRPSPNAWDETSLRLRLSLIARAWLIERSCKQVRAPLPMSVPVHITAVTWNYFARRKLKEPYGWRITAGPLIDGPKHEGNRRHTFLAELSAPEL